MSNVDSIPVRGLRISMEETKPAPRAGFRPDIEGLRALAVLLVVLYHCGVGLFTGGFVGVDVFFVISGYLITSHLAREATETGRLRIGRFYARRALRLLPAATLVLVSTLVAAWIWLPPLRLRGIAQDTLAAAGYVLNIRLIQVGTDYRSASAAPSPLQHFWSLAVEEQFYLAIPLLVLAGLVLLRRRAILVALLTVLVAASFSFSVIASQSSSVAAYFGAPTRAWELGVGALLALTFTLRLPNPAAIALRWLGVAAILAAAVLFDHTTPFPGWPAAVPVLGAAAVLAAGRTSPGVALRFPLLQFIGTRSYSWYLWHWPVLVIAPYVLGYEMSLFEKLLAAVFALGLAGLSYALVEQPLRHHERLRASSGRAGSFALGLTAAVVAVAFLALGLPSRQPQGEGEASALTLEGPPSARYQALSHRLEAAELTTALPRNLVPALNRAAEDEPEISRNGCFVAVPDDRTPKRCESLGADHHRATVVLFGDSHAAQWYPALSALAGKHHWQLAVFTKVMCSPADVHLYADAFHGDYRTCNDWRQDAIARIRALRPDLVVTTSIADHMDLVQGNDDPDATWATGWARTTAGLRAKGTDLVFLADTPAAKTDIPECLSQHPKNVQQCAQTPAEAAGSDQRARIAEAVRSAGARVVDPTPWFCGPDRCPVVVGNTLIYRDDNHITGQYARLLAPLLAEELIRKKPKN